MLVFAVTGVRLLAFKLQIDFYGIQKKKSVWRAGIIPKLSQEGFWRFCFIAGNQRKLRLPNLTLSKIDKNYDALANEAQAFGKKTENFRKLKIYQTANSKSDSQKVIVAKCNYKYIRK